MTPDQARIVGMFVAGGWSVYLHGARDVYLRLRDTVIAVGRNGQWDVIV